LRILVSTWGSYGDLYPYIGLGLELQRRGYRPLLAMPALYRPLVEREGLEFAPVRPDLDINDLALAARVMDPIKGAEVIFGEIIVPHLAETYADLMAASAGVEAVISHPASPASVILAEEKRLPWISSVLAPMSLFSAHDPVTPPPAPWLQPILATSLSLSRAFLWLTHRITQKWAEPIQEFRRARGLNRTGNPVIEGQHSPNLVLAMFSRVLAQPQPDWPANVCVTGASLYNGNTSDQLPPDIAKFLDGGAPPVVFTLGTSAVASAGRFYEVSTEVIDRLGLRAILLIGPHAVNRPKRRSDRVLLAEFAPHAALFSRAAAVVHQGGAGTLHQALAHGLPMLVVPHSHDQPDNARRAVAAGVARTVTPRLYTVSRVARELRALLAGRYAARAQEVADLVRRERGAVAAVDAIDQFLTRR
jgi:rhamnosyltransferase subunit B